MTATSSEQPHYFVSYNAADEQWAEWIAWQLEHAGFPTVIQAWDFRPGSNFVVEMDRAAGTADRTLIVLSPNFVASQFTQPEWAAAFAKDPTGSQRRLIPVLVAPTQTHGLLDQIIHINLVGLSPAEAAAELIAGLEPGRSKPTVEPLFPGTSMPRPAHPTGLGWEASAGTLLAIPRTELLPQGRPQAGPATVEVALVPTTAQTLLVGQLQRLSVELASIGRDGGLFSQATAIVPSHSAEVAFARSQPDSSAEQAGMLVTRAGQRTSWVTLPHDSMGSVVDPQQLQPRLSSLLRMMSLLDVPLAARYGFTAWVSPLTMVTVGDVAQVGHRTSTSLRTLRSDPFPLAMPDTIQGGTLAGNADELAGELVARILAALD